MPNTKIPDLSRDVFFRLRSQAVLQHHKAATGKINARLSRFPPGKGFTRMPVPDDSDLFFDMENALLCLNGLDYLFGAYYFKDGQELFLPFLAHNYEEEKEAFKRLGCCYAVCEEQLDNLLRNQKFIDLYLVVRESIRTSEAGYSIKNMETFCMDKRANAVATAAYSIIVYNEWHETGADELLQEIADYNEVDCVSSHLLCDWLLALKTEDDHGLRACLNMLRNKNCNVRIGKSNMRITKLALA